MIHFAAPLHRQLIPELQTIEIWNTMGIPNFRVVGLPGPEIIESCERVRASIEASGFEFPKKRVLVNLSPAGVRKHGTGTDLAIALAVIHSSRKQQVQKNKDRFIVASGELSLDGTLKSAGRVLRSLLSALNSNASDLILTYDDQEETRKSFLILQENGQIPQENVLKIHFANNLSEAFQNLQKREHQFPDWNANKSSTLTPPPSTLLPLAAEIERVIAVAGAGVHHLLLLGPKGTGKTSALQWLQYLRGRPNPQEYVEQLLVSELAHVRNLHSQRDCPLRMVSPHLRPEALIGGIVQGEVRPGEFSKAHGGILVADEFLEWPRDSRECLREPLEQGRLRLTRGHLHLEVPARFQLAASSNLCRCGGWPKNLHQIAGQPCRCSEKSQLDYLAKLSGPISDRIDIVKLILNPADRFKSRNDYKSRLLSSADDCRESLVRAWGKPPGLLLSSEVEDILQAEKNLSKAWDSIHGSKEMSLRRRHKEIRVALTLTAWDQINGKIDTLIPSKIQLREARGLSAESWIASLYHRKIRPRYQATSETKFDQRLTSI